MKISILIPVYNDEKHLTQNIDRLLFSLKKTNFEFELIIINDGSTDQTLKEIKKMKYENVRYETYEKNMGKGYAIKRGIENSYYNNILFTDADLAYPPSQIVKIMETFQRYNGKKMIIANRRHKNSKFILSYDDIRYVYLREIIGRTFNRLLKLLSLTSHQDTQSGLKIFPKDQIVINKISSNDFLFDVELLSYLKKKNLDIIDIPIEYTYHDSSSSLNIFKDSYIMFFKLLKLFIKLKKND